MEPNATPPQASPTRRVAIVTVSDRSWLALRADRSGPAIAERIEAWGWEPLGPEILPDDPDQVADALRRWCDAGVDLVLTTGGTGLAPRDRTPEATAEVAERIVPGIAEWIRAQSAARNPHACLSRGIAATRGRTLIVNLPGSPRAVGEYLDLLGPILPHAIDQLRSRPGFAGDDRHPGPQPG